MKKLVLSLNFIVPFVSFAQNSSTLLPNSVNITTNGSGFAGQFSSTNASPKALKTTGGVQLTGIGEATNKVLVSDASGNATWQSATIAFLAYLTTNSTGISNGTEGSLSAVTEVFDEGGDIALGVFKAPQDGIYHFDAGIKWGTNNSTSNFSQATIKKCDGSGNNCVIMASSKINNQVASQHSLGVNIKLVANETVKVFVIQTNSDINTRILEGQDGNGNRPTYFSGNLVR